ncbi:enediyne antibiotic chromoprotein [Streptomyces sp. NPDC001709]
MKYQRSARKGLVLAGVGIAAVLGLGGQASAAPLLAVSPASALSDGQSVSVTGSGYTPGSTIVLLQCDADKPQGTACDKQSLVAVTADAQGSISTKFTVHKAFTGTDLTGGTGTTSVDCGTGHCYIGSTDATHPGSQGTGVVISFG